jgi:ribonuclease-3
MAAAASLGAGLDWKTSLQELTAEHSLGVPEYVIEDEGPDHAKTFTAQVKVNTGHYGHGTGRSKKEAEQQAAETAYRELVAVVGGGQPVPDVSVEESHSSAGPQPGGDNPDQPAADDSGPGSGAGAA